MTDHESNDGILFLETTAQIDRIIGEKERRDAIRRDISGRTVSTSGHVLGEFNKTLMRDAVTFRDLLISSESVGEAIKRLRTFDRSYPRTVDLLATLGLDDDKQNTIDRLEKFIDWQGHDKFWENISPGVYVDEVGCVLKQWVPQRGVDGSYDLRGLKCLRGTPPPCGVQQFINRHQDEIRKFAHDAANAQRRNVLRSAQALSDILNGNDVPYGERSNCYVIADTMIVLESPELCEMYTTDGDVIAICEILGRRAFRADPLSL